MRTIHAHSLTHTKFLLHLLSYRLSERLSPFYQMASNYQQEIDKDDLTWANAFIDQLKKAKQVATAVLAKRQSAEIVPKSDQHLVAPLKLDEIHLDDIRESSLTPEEKTDVRSKLEEYFGGKPKQKKPKNNPPPSKMEGEEVQSSLTGEAKSDFIKQLEQLYSGRKQGGKRIGRKQRKRSLTKILRKSLPKQPKLFLY